jgi:hypothetical protein
MDDNNEAAQQDDDMILQKLLLLADDIGRRGNVIILQWRIQRTADWVALRCVASLSLSPMVGLEQNGMLLIEI